MSLFTHDVPAGRQAEVQELGQEGRQTGRQTDREAGMQTDREEGKPCRTGGERSDRRESQEST